MTRMDFLKQLEYLLQDIDEKDREDALEYYRDYMDEAGISEFASVDGMLDTPEKIAISIRASLNGDDEEQSEFSEQGVKDARWEPQKHMPDVYQKDGWTEAGNRQSDAGWQESSDIYSDRRNEDRYERDEWKTEGERENGRESRRGNNLGKILLIVILCIVGLPLIGGIGSAAFGVLLGICGAILAVVVGIGGSAIGFTVGGVVLFVMSIVHMVASVPEGIMMMGFSFIMLALGILFVLFTILICTRLIPWIVRGIVGLFRRIFHRGGAEA